MLWLLLAHTQCIRTFSSMFLRSFMLHHKHVWPRTLQRTRICMTEHTYMHSRCSNPITQTESLHKLLSVVAACPVKVKELFFSEPAVWQIPAFAIYICAQPDSSSLSSYSFIFLHLHVLKNFLLPSAFHSFTLSLSFHSFIHFQSQHFSYSSFMFWFLQKKKNNPSSFFTLSSFLARWTSLLYSFSLWAITNFWSP